MHGASIHIARTYDLLTLEDGRLELVYKNRLVAFIDVMGFKELLRLTPESRIKLQNYYSIVHSELESKAESFRLYFAEDDFQSLLVSDAVILSIVFEGSQSQKIQRAANFFNSVGILQYALATKCDIWTRGAISVGQLFIDGQRSILVGPAFVSAYELEKTADYPRVIVDPQVCQDVGVSPNEFRDRVNSRCNATGSASGLLQPDPSIRFGRKPFASNALQIDWFKHTWARNEDLSSFLHGIDERMVSNQGLFEKSQKLMGYLRESFDSYDEALRDGNEARRDEIDSFLERNGY